MVELRQVSEHACQPGIVGPTSDQPHGEDGIAGHGGVTVVGELAEGVQDGQLWIGGGKERQGKGNGSSNHRIPTMQLQESKFNSNEAVYSSFAGSFQKLSPLPSD